MDIFWVESSDPLHDAEDFYTYDEAVSRANEIADEMEAEGFTCDRSWASRRNMYAIHCTHPEFRPITIEVNDDR
jgi:hypothetical protein